MAPPRIEASGVGARYGRRPVLRDVALSLRQGEVVGVVGPNGAGKSTLLRVLSRVIPRCSGEVRIDGVSADSLSARELARLLAFVPQVEPALFDFTVREVVMMGRSPHARVHKRDMATDAAHVRAGMAATDCLHLADRPITMLSGGEHRRVLLARALAQDTPTLLLDEPTAHLDLTHQAALLRMLRGLARESGRSSLAALHDLNLAADYCDRMVLLARGQVVSEGTPEDVLRPSTLEAAYGSPLFVTRKPTTGRPLVLPMARTPEAAEDGPTARVHVVCGGGAGSGVLTELVHAGLTVTAGVLNRLDTDHETALALGIECVVEAPFSPIGADAADACRKMASAADLLVVAPIAIGRGNLRNLEMARALQQENRALLVIDDGAVVDRDFSGGPGTALWRSILSDASERLAPDEPVAAIATALAREQSVRNGSAG